jgi:hypothetical protein
VTVLLAINDAHVTHVLSFPASFRTHDGHELMRGLITE